MGIESMPIFFRMSSNNQSFKLSDKSSRYFSAVLLVAVLLLYLHPYYGIRHDAILYLGQALLRKMPEQFGSDLFFVHGSQAEFTLFPDLLAWALDNVDAGALFRMLTLAGQAFFLLASWWLIAKLWPEGQRFWPLLALLLLPSGYGGYGIFSYAEPFLTGRTFSEPLVLISLALWFMSRHAAAIGLWLLAMLIHPLQALPALLVAWLDLIRRDWRWLHFFWFGLLVVLASAVFGVAPDAMYQRYDPEWMDVLLEHNRQVLLTQWEPADWSYLVIDGFLVMLVARWADATLLKRFSWLVFLATFVGCLLSLIFADAIQWVLGTGFQLWRAQWLLHWLAVASSPWLLIQCYRHEGHVSARLLMLVGIIASGTHVATGWHSSWFSSYAPAFGSSPLAVIMLIPLFLAWPTIRGKVGHGYMRLLTLGLMVFLFLSLARAVYSIIGTSALFGYARNAVRIEFLILSLPLISALLVATAIIAWYRHSAFRPIFLVALFFLVAFAAQSWDRRTVWMQEMESHVAGERPFEIDLKEGATVYWKDDLIAPWLVLQRPSYFTQIQLAGALFNRKTAQLGNERAHSLLPFEVQADLCKMLNALSDTECDVDEETMREVCIEAKEKLDYLIVEGMKGPSSLGEWQVPGGGLRGDKVIKYYLYSCETLVSEKTVSLVLMPRDGAS